VRGKKMKFRIDFLSLTFVLCAIGVCQWTSINGNEAKKEVIVGKKSNPLTSKSNIVHSTILPLSVPLQKNVLTSAGPVGTNVKTNVSADQTKLERVKRARRRNGTLNRRYHGRRRHGRRRHGRRRYGRRRHGRRRHGRRRHGRRRCYGRRCRKPIDREGNTQTNRGTGHNTQDNEDGRNNHQVNKG